VRRGHSSLADMEVLFDKIPLANVTTSMTIQFAGRDHLGSCIWPSPKTGRDWKKLSGTLRIDILKEYIAQRNTSIRRNLRCAGNRHVRIQRQEHAKFIPFRSAAITSASRLDRHSEWPSLCAMPWSTSNVGMRRGSTSIKICAAALLFL